MSRLNSGIFRIFELDQIVELQKSFQMVSNSNQFLLLNFCVGVWVGGNPRANLYIVIEGDRGKGFRMKNQPKIENYGGSKFGFTFANFSAVESVCEMKFCRHDFWCETQSPKIFSKIRKFPKIPISDLNPTNPESKSEQLNFHFILDCNRDRAPVTKRIWNWSRC